MKKFVNIRLLVVFSIAIAIIFADISVGAINGNADPFTEIKDRLSGITEKERAMLQDLFTLTQEIELMEAEEKKLSKEITKINLEISKMEVEISKGELAYDKKQESLKRVLQSYQRMGPGSFLEILLDSDNLGTFLQRLNILRDLTRNTGVLLDQLEESSEMLSQVKAELSEKLVLLEEKQRQSIEAMAGKTKLKLELEEYLASLKGEREYYEKYLTDIERTWEELKPVFSKAAQEFSRIIREGSLPADALRITFSLFEVRGAIDDKVINDVVAEQSDITNIVFAFHPGRVEISMPDKYLILSGTFEILEGHILKFRAKEGSFYGMPLEPGSMEELFSEGDLLLDIKPQLAGNSVHALEIKEGYIELISKLHIF